MRVLSALLAAFAVIAPAACGPDARAQHHATAAAMLERSGSPDFENASTADYAALKHTPSGMLCVLPTDGAFDFGVFPAAATNAGAHCSMARGDVATTLMAVRFADGVTLDTAFQEAVNATAGQAGATQWPGEPSEADKSSPEGLPHFRIARFQATLDGAPHYLRIAMSEARGWYLQQIVSAPIADADSEEARAGQEWRFALREFAVSH